MPGEETGLLAILLYEKTAQPKGGVGFGVSHYGQTKRGKLYVRIVGKLLVIVSTGLVIPIETKAIILIFL
jgi:hypothetical protein